MIRGRNGCAPTSNHPFATTNGHGVPCPFRFHRCPFAARRQGTPCKAAVSSHLRLPQGLAAFGAEVVLVTVEGMGHTWAGGKSLLPESMVGKTSDKIRATDAIWDFFVRHPMAGKK